MTSRALNRAEAGPVPREALDFFDRKRLRPGFDHRDVWEEEHLRAFTAAKFMRRDVLDAVRDSLGNALAQGQTYESWRRNLQPQLESLGFWGRQSVVDPATGEPAEIFVPHRLRRIFDTNMRTARAAGQWERIQRTKASHPFLLYLLGPSQRHRPEHVAFHGLLLPVEDPFWQTHFPPNGFGCHCHIRQVTPRQAERLERDGVRAPAASQVLDDAGLPTGRRSGERIPVRRAAPEIRHRDWLNRRTGEIESVPEGVDPGFAHPPSTRLETPRHAPAEVEPDEIAQLRAEVFEGEEAVPRAPLTPERVGVLLGEAMAAHAADGGRRIRRLFRAVVRQALGDMLREGSTEGQFANVVRFGRLKRGVHGIHTTPTGLMRLRTGARRTLERIAVRLENGQRLSRVEREALHAILHESIHGFGYEREDVTEHRSDVLRPASTAVEESVTDTVARQVLRENFGVEIGLPDIATGEDSAPFYTDLHLYVIRSVGRAARQAGLLTDLSIEQQTTAIIQMIEETSVAMRRGPIRLPAKGRNPYVWAWVATVPFRGDAESVRTARRALYDYMAKVNQHGEST